MKVIRCDCSRCNLYLRVTTDLGDLDYHSEVKLKSACFEDRKYQTALIEYGKTHNIMACLPTGSGKTFIIALKLIEHFKPAILSEDKKVFFLANTIPLVNQQAAFIHRNSSFKVRHLTGDMDVDYWTTNKWDAIVNEFNVMAMTSMIFLNMIKHGYIKFSQIALIIFDECHHAFGGHPMALTMKEYARTKESDPNYNLPRILGLSATIISGTCKPREVPTKIQNLEEMLQSAALTYKDYEEVLIHSTSSNIERIRVFSDNNPLINDSHVSKMEKFSKELQVVRQERKKAKMIEAKLSPNYIDPELRSFDNVYNLQQKKPSPGDLKVALDDVLHAYKELGLYCALISINLRLAFIEFSLMDINDKSYSCWYIKIRDFFKELKKDIINTMADRCTDEKKYVTTFISPKLKSLVHILEKYRKYEEAPQCQFGNDNRLCGLVFSDRRATAQVLAWYLKDLAENSKEEHGFIRANFVVGTSRSAFESVESRVYARKQVETLNNFRIKHLNLLTATSVLEEGIDVPSCNFVVRFDPVQTYTSFIQSMGRARKKGATFYAMLPDADYDKLSSKLDLFQEINKEIISYLKKNVEKIDADLLKINSAWEPDMFPPICPGGMADSPKITVDSAPDVVERYCMLLPCDGISTLQTISWWNERLSIRTEYQAFLKLPLNGALRETIIGIPMKNKELAQQSVFMEAAKQLLEAGCLDDRLIPFHPLIPIKIQKYFKNIVPFGEGPEEEEPEPGEISEKENNSKKSNNPSEKQAPEKEVIYQNEWYIKRQPKLLVDVPLIPNVHFKAYRFKFNLVQQHENLPWKTLYNKLGNSHVGFAIITSQRLPNVGVFPLFGAFGQFHCTLTPLKLRKKIDDRLFEKLKYAQHKMFSDVLGLKHGLFRNSKDSAYLIAAITNLNDSNEWTLDEDIEKELQELDGIQKMRRPQRPRDQSRSRVPPVSKINLKRRYEGYVVFPWYKKPKPAYFVDSIMEETPRMEWPGGGTLKNFLETEFRIKIQDHNQNLLKCKLSGIALGRCEKDPLQMNYLLEKFTKEDEYYPIPLVPELVYSINLPASFFIQLKFLPSVLHRLSRLLLAHEIICDISTMTGWPKMRCSSDVLPDVNELKLVSSAHETKKMEEEVRRKRRVELRDEKFRSKKLKPLSSNKQHIEQRELHYEFIHPNAITLKDIKLFHEAVSFHHSAKKLTLTSAEIELVESETNSDLSLASKFELHKMEDIDLEVIDKPINKEVDAGPSLLTVMEALSSKMSNEGLAGERYQFIGSSFLSFAASLFAFCNFPSYGEPLLVQLRNNLLSLRILHAIAKMRAFPEMMSGSDFHPGASWIPPGKKIFPEYLGDLVAANKLHLNVFDELISQNPRDGFNKVHEMTRQQLEEFVNLKAATIGSTTEPPKDVPSNSDRRSRQNRKKAIYSFKHSTFTHTELSDFEVVDRLYSFVGTFFVSNGPQGAYKALQWLNIQAPDLDGIGRDLNDLTKAPDMDTEENGQISGQQLYPQFEPLEKLIEYQFKNKTLLLQAFTHPTYPGHNLRDCYQRLEFIGDSVLDLLLTNHVYGQGPCDHTGDDLQDIRSALVNSVTYASLAVRYGFQKYLLSMSKPLTDMIDNFVVYQESVEHHVVGHFCLITDEECRGPKHIEVPKVLGDIWEALAGAIFVDSGFSLDAVWRVYYRLMLNELDVFWETKPQSPIRELKSWMIKEDIAVKFQSFSGEKTRARGRECCRVDMGPYGHYFGMGTNFYRARQAAAKIALKLIKEETDFIKDRDATKICLVNI